MANATATERLSTLQAGVFALIMVGVLWVTLPIIVADGQAKILIIGALHGIGVVLYVRRRMPPASGRYPTAVVLVRAAVLTPLLVFVAGFVSPTVFDATAAYTIGWTVPFVSWSLVRGMRK